MFSSGEYTDAVFCCGHDCFCVGLARRRGGKSFYSEPFSKLIEFLNAKKNELEKYDGDFFGERKLFSRPPKQILLLNSIQPPRLLRPPFSGRSKVLSLIIQGNISELFLNRSKILFFPESTKIVLNTNLQPMKKTPKR